MTYQLSTTPLAIDANLYLSGNLGPVSEETTATDLEVIGELPEELDGRYLRNGPNPIGSVDPARHHWFVGEGMVHGVRLSAGCALWYRSRFVRTPDVSTKLGEAPRPNPFGPERPVVPANTNVIGLAGRTYAIVEAGGLPIELTDELDTVGPSDLGGSLAVGFTAHPKTDPVTGELHAVSYFWGWGNKVQYLVVGRDGAVRRAVDVPVGDGSPMMHDLALTASRVVLFDLPCIFDLDAAASGAPLPYRWHPEYGARLIVLDKEGRDRPITIPVEPCYVFHPLNAYDLDDGRIVVDVVRHPRMFDRDVFGVNEGKPTLDRWTIDPMAATVKEERLDDRPLEFPRVDERLVGRPHRYGYGVSIGRDWEHGGLIRHDFQRGTSEVHDYGAGRGTMEAVFIPRHDQAAEDDGWLMSLVHDRQRNRGELVVLNASDFTGEPVARVLLPARVPYGFHGNWIPS